MQDYDDFKVGDDVWCIIHGKGKVVCVDGKENYTYPVLVQFGNNDEEWYTCAGQLEEFCARTLYFSEPKIEASVKRPFVPTLVGKTVFVKPWNSMGKVVGENADSFWFESGTAFYKQNVGDVFEVIPENLLEKK